MVGRLREENQERYDELKAELLSWLLQKDVGCVVMALAAKTLADGFNPDGTIISGFPAELHLKVCSALC